MPCYLPWAVKGTCFSPSWMSHPGQQPHPQEVEQCTLTNSEWGQGGPHKATRAVRHRGHPIGKATGSATALCPSLRQDI